MEKFLKIVIYFFIFLYPLFFLPVTTDTHEYNKMMLMLVFSLFLAFLFIIKTVYYRKLVVRRLNYFFPLLFLGFISAISAFVQSPNPVISFLSPLGASTLLGGTVLYLLLANLLDTGDSGKSGIIFILSGCAVSLYLIATRLNLIPASLNTPAGSLLFALIYIFTVLFYVVVKIIFLAAGKSLGENRSGKSLPIFLFVSSVLFVITLLVTILNVFKEDQIALLPWTFGWSIITEQLKGLRTTLLGVGPANFLSAFTLVKPIEINSTPVWNILFTSSSSFFLTLITETGILSGILFLSVLLKSVRHFALAPDRPLALTLIVLMVISLLFPFNMTLFITLIVLISLNEVGGKMIEINLQGAGKTVYLPLVPLILSLFFLMYLITRAYFAEVYFKSALSAAQKNRGSELYILQTKAIKLNPEIDRYHLAFSQTNLTLANALSQKRELTQSDKENIPRLIQQAIDQAKIAAKLNRTSIINWDNLAKTYSSLAAFAQDSQSWAIQAYEQRIALDPINPSGYLSLGGFYLSLGKFPEAEIQLRKAVSLKSDYANGYYNLALSLAGQKKEGEALENLQKAKSLVKPRTEDERKILEEISKLQIQNSK